ncbi:MAG TPA: hypothetical protein VNT79_16535 [Phycisphaerae bacterium]|nr:hypothetical protein [Phycisphaerae bacterium]
MPKMFQIHDDDLSDLERTLPEIADRLMCSMDNALRIKLRRVQKILSDVRWNYGPPAHVEKIVDDELNAQ